MTILRNSEQLTGFSESEIELVALIARFHRRSRPSEKHREFAALNPEDQNLVRVLAGLLRVAIGLDRRHTSRVTAVTVRAEITDETEAGSEDGEEPAVCLVIEPVVADGEDVSVEVAAAASRSELLVEVLGIEIVVRERPARASDADLLSSES